MLLLRSGVRCFSSRCCNYAADRYKLARETPITSYTLCCRAERVLWDYGRFDRGTESLVVRLVPRIVSVLTVCLRYWLNPVYRTPVAPRHYVCATVGALRLAFAVCCSASRRRSQQAYMVSLTSALRKFSLLLLSRRRSQVNPRHKIDTFATLPLSVLDALTAALSLFSVSSLADALRVRTIPLEVRRRAALGLADESKAVMELSLAAPPGEDCEFASYPDGVLPSLYRLLAVDTVTSALAQAIPLLSLREVHASAEGYLLLRESVFACFKTLLDGHSPVPFPPTSAKHDVGRLRLRRCYPVSEVLFLATQLSRICLAPVPTRHVPVCLPEAVPVTASPPLCTSPNFSPGIALLRCCLLPRLSEKAASHGAFLNTVLASSVALVVIADFCVSSTTAGTFELHNVVMTSLQVIHQYLTTSLLSLDCKFRWIVSHRHDLSFYRAILACYLAILCSFRSTVLIPGRRLLQVESPPFTQAHSPVIVLALLANGLFSALRVPDNDCSWNRYRRSYSFSTFVALASCYSLHNATSEVFDAGWLPRSPSEMPGTLPPRWVDSVLIALVLFGLPGAPRLCGMNTPEPRFLRQPASLESTLIGDHSDPTPKHFTRTIDCLKRIRDVACAWLPKILASVSDVLDVAFSHRRRGALSTLQVSAARVPASPHCFGQSLSFLSPALPSTPYGTGSLAFPLRSIAAIFYYEKMADFYRLRVARFIPGGSWHRDSVQHIFDNSTALLLKSMGGLRRSGLPPITHPTFRGIPAEVVDGMAINRNPTFVSTRYTSAIAYPSAAGLQTVAKRESPPPKPCSTHVEEIIGSDLAPVDGSEDVSDFQVALPWNSSCVAIRSHKKSIPLFGERNSQFAALFSVLPWGFNASIQPQVEHFSF